MAKRKKTDKNIQKNKNNKEFTDQNASATALFVSEGTIPTVVTVSALPLCIRYINLQLTWKLYFIRYVHCHDMETILHQVRSLS
jgi:hypothetical protein